MKPKYTHLQAVLNTVIDGIITINSDGLIDSFNPSAERIFGYKADEVIGKNVKVLMPDPYHTHHDTYLSSYKTTGKKKIIGIGREVAAKHKNGTVFPIELGVSDMEVNGKQMFVGTIRDITERKEALSEIMRSNMELERFAYVASHDLQEPLRMVVNFMALLEKKYVDQLDDQAKEYISYASSGAKRMQELVNDLLEYARIGQESEKVDDVNLSSVLKIVEENLKDRIVETKTQIIIASPLPIVKGSPVRMCRVLQNLIGNSIKYQKDGCAPEINISANLTDNAYEIAVSDNGIGMNPEYCEKIFEPFKRLHAKDKYSGTGMGLAICRRLVEGWGGSIRAESSPDNGAKFIFTIPVQTPTKEERVQ